MWPHSEPTLVEQFLSGFVRIHVGFLEGDIDISIGMVPHDFLDGLNGFSDSSREHVGASATFSSRTSDHCIQNRRQPRRGNTKAKPKKQNLTLSLCRRTEGSLGFFVSFVRCSQSKKGNDGRAESGFVRSSDGVRVLKTFDNDFVSVLRGNSLRFLIGSCTLVF